ncbi:MAG: hypothetical protein C4344_00425 [Acidimicrobiia bacterium]
MSLECAPDGAALVHDTDGRNIEHVGERFAALRRRFYQDDLPGRPREPTMQGREQLSAGSAVRAHEQDECVMEPRRVSIEQGSEWLARSEGANGQAHPWRQGGILKAFEAYGNAECQYQRDGGDQERRPTEEHRDNVHGQQAIE